VVGVIIRERYLARIRPFYNKDLIKAITGFRRSVKSVLLQQIRGELAQDAARVLMINFESHLHADLLDHKRLDAHVARFAQGNRGSSVSFLMKSSMWKVGRRVSTPTG